MKPEEVRFVWMFVFFDLPVGTKTDRRWATKFRNFLKDDGFMMLQWSVLCARLPWRRRRRQT